MISSIDIGTRNLGPWCTKSENVVISISAPDDTLFRDYFSMLVSDYLDRIRGCPQSIGDSVSTKSRQKGRCWGRDWCRRNHDIRGGCWVMSWTLLVLRPEHSGKACSISLLLMPWLFAPPGHQQQCIEHYNDVIMGAITSQITSLTIVYSTVYSDADQRKHQDSASLAFVRGIHRWPVNSPTNGQ